MDEPMETSELEGVNRTIAEYGAAIENQKLLLRRAQGDEYDILHRNYLRLQHELKDQLLRRNRLLVIAKKDALSSDRLVRR
jgi:hypothetical protein